MANLRGTVFVLLLVTLTAACDDGGPTGPSSVTPVTPMERITITMEDPYIEWSEYEPQNPGISEVTVTCVVGCDGQQIEMTDSQGSVTFTGRSPLTIRAEKSGYIPAEKYVWDTSRVILGHEWPAESAASFRRLQLPFNLVLHWNEDDVTVQGGYWGEYNCSVILVRRRADRRIMLNVWNTSSGMLTKTKRYPLVAAQMCERSGTRPRMVVSGGLPRMRIWRQSELSWDWMTVAISQNSRPRGRRSSTPCLSALLAVGVGLTRSGRDRSDSWRAPG